jgi:uncharacterized membrane protein YkoI
MKEKLPLIMLALCLPLAAQTQDVTKAAAAPTPKPPTVVQLAKTPAAVQTTIQSQVGNNTVGDIVKLSDDEGTVFGVSYTTKDGSDRDLMVASNGTLESAEIALDEAPPAVQTAIKSHTGVSKVNSIDKVFDEGEITYDVELGLAGGSTRSFSVNADGNILSMEIALTDVPQNVQDTIKTQAGDAKITSVEKTADDGEIGYDVVMTTKDGSERDLSVGEDGKLVSLEVTLADAPAAVQAEIATEAPAAKVVNIDKNFDDEDGTTYDVTVKPKNAREWDFTLSEAGVLVSREVFLNQAPPAIRQAIQEQIGDGVVVRIDHVFATPGDPAAFEVQGLKDGHAFNFSIGPGGKFLGMDDD